MADQKPTKLVQPALEPVTPPTPARDPPRVAKFDPSQIVDDEPAFDVNPFTPRKHHADEPEIAQGVDLSGKTKIVFVNGRGKTGKTTFLRWVAERAILGERPLLMADLDPTNASFSSYFGDVARPPTDDPVGVANWMQKFIEYAIDNNTTAVLDMGGGDTTLRETAAQMPGFHDAITAGGAVPVLLSMMGVQPDDLAPVATLVGRGFVPEARAIILNEASLEVGSGRREEFGRIFRNSVMLDQLRSGAIPLWMPRLHAATAVESRRSTFAEARDGVTVPPLGLFDRSRVRSWLDLMERRFSGILSWLP